MVSIIIPNYNRAHYLEQSINSVIDQEFLDWELLIVDDGSTDNSKELVTAYVQKDSRIRWIERQGDEKGASICRNIGLKQSRGDYIVFLDSDDLLAPYCLEKRINIMRNNNFDFVVFPMLLFYKDVYDSGCLWNIETNEPDLNRFLKLDPVWQTSGPIWRKEFLLDLAGFEERLNCWQDVDIHIRALLTNPNYKKFYQLPPDCFYRRNSENSISQQEINSPSKLNSRFFLVQKLEGMVPHKSMIKHLCANVLISSLKVSSSIFFLKGYFWAIRKSIFNRNEIWILFQLSTIILFRFYRFNFFNNRKNRLMQSIIFDKTVGKINYETKN